ncbi:hypothetical protein PHJA_001381600 [Phtheirospermum japonicum]|uniref:Uncharacterized protein n=1 Tax=Phtheirospermum japonicum TaxID=374723 RepID=A0A830CB59_9LAMI|nr:hypothetical protein PHJA_001381600 [Phtheirospermum japonicum]
MASNCCLNETFSRSYNNCTSAFEDYCSDDVQEHLDAPMPWIGMYIAAASATCAIAMAADAFNGFRKKKLWFPSKYFSLNAFSLTVLAVAMKLPVDLTTKMDGINDGLARVSSLVLMSIAMTNFMASLGSMENNEIVLNLAALGILVITIAGNVFTRLFQIRHYTKLADGEEVSSTVYMLLLLVTLCSSAVMVHTAKRYIESQYNQKHKMISNEREDHIRKFTIHELREKVRRYWMMSESGSPQFVIAHSVPCVTAGAMCLVLALTLLLAYIRVPLENRNKNTNNSDYKRSTNWILAIQTIGVTVGTVAPLLRWFTAAHFKSTMIGHKSLKDEFEVEAFWTRTLEQWRDSPIPLRLGHQKFRKTLHNAKRLLLNFFIGVQFIIVFLSKLALLVSAVFVKGLLCIKKFRARKSRESDDHPNDLSDYVLLLEGEAEVPKRTLQNICNEVDKLIRMGKKKQSKNLIELLQKSANFNGDSSEIPSSRFQQQPNFWSLPVVTLTIIAISFANITDHNCKQLITAVSEGLYFVKRIEETLDSNGELASIRKAADVIWVRVELYKKWLDQDLNAATLLELHNIAKTTITNFKSDANNYLVQDPLNWPAEVIAADSMYRITQTIMLDHDDDHPQKGDEMFESLSVMISDMLVACLTNLARVIMLKCHSNAITEREKSIRQAALLLGESENILASFLQHELQTLDPDSAAADMEQDNGNPGDSVSATFSQTRGGHVSIEMGR